MSRLSEDSAAPPLAGSATPEFTLEQRRILLGIARASIASALAGEPLPDLPPASTLLSPPDSTSAASSTIPASSFSPDLLRTLRQPRGVFTTLYLGGDLRGCVGYPLPIRPLFRAIAETARAAAFEDPRFWPVKPEEAPHLKISLSVLSPLFPISASQVEVGRHGLLISDGRQRGLLLPQVPIEHGWDRETFLAQTCHKAGLPLDAWRKPATLEAFTAEVFGDDDFPQLT